MGAEQVSLANETLQVILSLPSGLLTITDLRSGTVWRQDLPTRMARSGSKWGAVATQPVPDRKRIRLQDARVDGDTIRATATWRKHPFHIAFRLVAETPQL